MSEITDYKSVAARLSRMARQRKEQVADAPNKVRATKSCNRQSTSSLLRELLARPEGATLDQMVKATC